MKYIPLSFRAALCAMLLAFTLQARAEETVKIGILHSHMFQASLAASPAS